jgi:hypothetical protein
MNANEAGFPLLSLLTFLPLIGGGGTRFQPVYVGDVAEADPLPRELVHHLPQHRHVPYLTMQ